MRASQPASRGSLSRQFAGAAAALSAVSVMLLAAGSWWWIERLQQDSGRTLQQRDVELRAIQVGETLGRVDERVRELANSPLLSTALTDSSGRETYLRPYLGGIQSVNTVPIELLLVDFEGNEIARNGDVSFSPEERQTLRAPLTHGKPVARVSTEQDILSLLVAEPILYPRTQTVEGAVWMKLRLAGLLRAEGHALRLEEGIGAVPDGVLRASVPLPESMASLRLFVEAQAREHTMIGVSRYVAPLMVYAVGLVAVMGFVGQRLARRLTADLAALDRFANAVAQTAASEGRALVQGTDEVAGLAASINRMLERLQSQHQALQSEARSQLLLLATGIAHLNDVVIITEADADGAEGHRIVFVNEAFTRVTGYTSDEVVGRGPKMLQGPATDTAELRRVGDSLRRWEPARAEVMNYAKSGVPFWVEMEIVPVKDAEGWVTHWVSIERDVTTRREAEETRRSLEQQVRESQKMEAIGTLAGGIAHDFNNILGAILGNVALAQDDQAKGLPVTDRLDQIGRSARRARSLVQQILTYSRRQRQVRTPQDLRVLVEEAVSLLRATVPARVALCSRLPDHAVLVEGDATELTQVLVNLGTNAWQSTNESAGHVEVGLEIAGADATAAAGATLAKQHAHLWVADNGCGMDAQTQARIFEPFFTTKPVGEGTGLGLSVVQGIVRSMGGTISMESSPGVGTTFHVRFPMLANTAGVLMPTQAPMPAADPVYVPPGHGEWVLYLDDDDVMCAVVSALLQRWGYNVRTTQNTEEAIALVRSGPQRFDALITDFNMPGMSGIEVLRALRQIDPMLPVILTSGFISDAMQSEALAAGARHVVRKENLQDELAAVMSTLLRDFAA